jgi:hypothetical protein
MRSPIMVCAVVGLVAGGLVPALWGASTLGFQSLLLGVLGGLAGVWVGAKLTA